MVSPVSATDANRDAADYYNLEIWQYSGLPDRRQVNQGASQRRDRAGATDHDERRSTDQRAGERRGGDRRVEHRRDLEPRHLEGVGNVGERTDRRRFHRRRSDLIKARAD